LSAAGNPRADLQQSRGHRSVVETSAFIRNIKRYWNMNFLAVSPE
jgi:hypothetical protein